MKTLILLILIVPIFGGCDRPQAERVCTEYGDDFEPSETWIQGEWEYATIRVPFSYQCKVSEVMERTPAYLRRMYEGGRWELVSSVPYKSWIWRRTKI